MKNLIFIQAEKFGQTDYMFVDRKQITAKPEIVKILGEKDFLNGKFDFSLSKHAKPYSETIKRIPKGYLIKGLLNEKDVENRFMIFSCIYFGSSNNIEKYLTSCFVQIDKTFNNESLVIIKNSIHKYEVVRNLLLGAITLTIGYTIFKLI